jgi:hypothetical protein
MDERHQCLHQAMLAAADNYSVTAHEYELDDVIC